MDRSGLIGSLYYGSKLTEAEADKIRFYFNYDMIGSPYPQFAVYADNDGHKVGAAPLLEYLKSKGKPAYYGYVDIRVKQFRLKMQIANTRTENSARPPITWRFSNWESLHLGSLLEPELPQTLATTWLAIPSRTSTGMPSPSTPRRLPVLPLNLP